MIYRAFFALPPLTNSKGEPTNAVLGFITISQNDIFKVLTVASIVGIPPTLMAGIYGMNFKNMPELSWTFGYPFGWFVIIVSALIPLAWFKWKGWSEVRPRLPSSRTRRVLCPRCCQSAMGSDLRCW